MLASFVSHYHLGFRTWLLSSECSTLSNVLALPNHNKRNIAQHMNVLIKLLLIKLQGNLGWAYMQKGNFMMAEVVYRKAQMIDADSNKACNLGLSLIKQGRYEDAQLVLEDVLHSRLPGADETKSRRRAHELLMELKSIHGPPESLDLLGLDDDFVKGLEQLMNERGPFRSKRLPIFEEISQFRDQVAC